MRYQTALRPDRPSIHGFLRFLAGLRESVKPPKNGRNGQNRLESTKPSRNSPGIVATLFTLGERMRSPRSLIDAKDRDYVRLYVISCDRFLKVGLAKDIEKRISAAALLNPFPLRMVMSRRVSRNIARSVERRAHELLKPWHHDREWFTAPIEEVREAIRVAMLEGARLETRDRRLERARLEALIEAQRLGVDAYPLVRRRLREAASEMTEKDARLATAPPTSPSPSSQPCPGS